MLLDTTPSLRARLALLAVPFAALLACAALLSGASASASAATVAPLPEESVQAYEQQLAGGQIKAAALNTTARSIHATLSDGKVELVHYPPHHEKALLEALKAKGITPVSLKGKPLSVPHGTKHKLRYIVGGIIVVVLLLIGAALLLLRRRRAAAEY
ncbi:MAG TPA: hypothetical protein VKV16_01335 [Solirubrobacteraceae bacterium]|nr:hypothetical protein [Solirubrobacteraceae bacterium]